MRGKQFRSSQRLSKLVSKRDYDAEEKDTSLLVGLILGGGTIRKSLVSKTSKHYDHLLYVKNLLEQSGYHCNFKEGDKSCQQWVLSVSVSAEIAHHYKHQFYPNGNKTITRHLLNELTNDALSIWLLLNSHEVDGGLALGTLKFTYDENVIIQHYFQTVHNLDARLRKSRDKFYIYLTHASKEALFKKVYVPRSTPCG